MLEDASFAEAYNPFPISCAVEVGVVALNCACALVGFSCHAGLREADEISQQQGGVLSCIPEIVAQIHNVEDSNLRGCPFFPTPNGWIVVDAAGIHFLQLFQGVWVDPDAFHFDAVHDDQLVDVFDTAQHDVRL